MKNVITISWNSKRYYYLHRLQDWRTDQQCWGNTHSRDLSKASRWSEARGDSPMKYREISYRVHMHWCSVRSQCSPWGWSRHRSLTNGKNRPRTHFSSPLSRAHTAFLWMTQRMHTSPAPVFHTQFHLYIEGSSQEILIYHLYKWCIYVSVTTQNVITYRRFLGRQAWVLGLQWWGRWSWIEKRPWGIEGRDWMCSFLPLIMICEVGVLKTYGRMPFYRGRWEPTETVQILTR